MATLTIGGFVVLLVTVAGVALFSAPSGLVIAGFGLGYVMLVTGALTMTIATAISARRAGESVPRSIWSGIKGFGRWILDWAP